VNALKPEIPWRFLGPEGHRARPAVRFVFDVEPARQLDLLAKLEAVGPHRDRRAHVRSLEANGKSTLEAREEAKPKRPWFVRFYYVSDAGEKLAATFGGLTEPDAARLASVHGADKWPSKPAHADRVKCTGLDESDALAEFYPKFVGACANEAWCKCRGGGLMDPPVPTLRRGYREVIFPSESTVVLVEVTS
jgi:hypothetical protein